MNKIIIKNLDIGSNRLTDCCCDSLSTIVNCNSLMELLTCDNNELGILTLKNIAVALQNNNYLTKLDLHGNNFYGNQQVAIIQCFSLKVKIHRETTG